MAYCSANRVRLLSNLESSDINDVDIREIRDNVATPELNDDVQVDIKDERVERITEHKDNKINGSNKTFYVRKPHKSFWRVGDFNDDGTVDDSDLNAYYIDGDTRESNLSVTLKDEKIGKFEITESNGDAIPGTAELFVSYSAAPADMQTPDKQVEIACAQLTAAYALTRIEAGKLQDFSVGNITVNSRAEGFQKLRSDYRETVQNITQKEVIQSGKNKQGIGRVF